MGDFKEFRFKFNEKNKSFYTIFLRQHRVREKNDAKPTDRTIFVSGVPPFLNEDTIKSIFSSFGNVRNVYIHKTPCPNLPEENESKYFKNIGNVVGFKVAYVVFENPRHMELALSNEKEMIVSKKLLINGIKKWATEYNDRVPTVSGMQQDIDNFIMSYDASAVEKNLKEKKETEEDEDGWITVNKKSRKPGFARKESVMKQLSKKIATKKQKKELNNFYRFQIKESKMKNLMALREKFEEDKRRIAAIKATRRFKPF